jgi:sarcosine oxidase gamma subunit
VQVGRQSREALAASAAPHAERTCASCGRRTPATAAADAKYCSDACRRHKVDRTDLALEAAIGALLDARAATSSTCPSEAARAVAPDDWRPLMERARRAARRMVARGEAEITQGGSVVDPSTAKGPIRIRRPR